MKKKTTTGRGRPKQPIKRYVSKEAINQLNIYLDDNPPIFNHELETFWFLLDLLYRLPLYNKDLRMKENGFVPIASSYFKQHIPNNYADYLRVLIDAKLLYCDDDFCEIEHICLGYKLNPLYEGKLTCLEVMPNTKIWKAITKKRNSLAPKSKMQPHIKLMKDHFKKIEFDHQGAIQYLDWQLNQGEISLNQYNIRYLAVQALRHKAKELFFKQNHTNFRVDTNLTNLKRELRNFIKGDDLIQIDLSNSQPYLFNFILLLVSDRRVLSFSDVNTPFNPLNPFIDRLLRRLINSQKLEMDELLRYNEWTRSGKIYELFVSNFNISRDEAKELFLATFYSSNYSVKYAPAKKVFEAEFPSIYRLIVTLKHKDHTLLPIAMQNLESDIFIDGIARELCEMGIVPYTVHDSIIIERRHCKAALKVMEDVFIRYFGEIPTFKVESLSPEKLSLTELAQENEQEQLCIPFVYEFHFEHEILKSA